MLAQRPPKAAPPSPAPARRPAREPSWTTLPPPPPLTRGGSTLPLPAAALVTKARSSRPRPSPARPPPAAPGFALPALDGLFMTAPFDGWLDASAVLSLSSGGVLVPPGLPSFALRAMSGSAGLQRSGGDSGANGGKRPSLDGAPGGESKRARVDAGAGRVKGEGDGAPAGADLDVGGVALPPLSVAPGEVGPLQLRLVKDADFCSMLEVLLGGELGGGDSTAGMSH